MITDIRMRSSKRSSTRMEQSLPLDSVLHGEAGSFRLPVYADYRL